MINGGTSVNTIASDANLELDLRSESPRELHQLVEQVEQLVREADERGRGEVDVQAEVIGDRPGGEISITHPLVQAAIACFTQAGIPVKLNIGSTDANVPLSRGYPAICVGLTNGGGSHTMGEYIETAHLEQGFRILVDLVRSIFRMDR
jgi:acetylornithine deacetylase/succinyl-diaminopimelate desuccinylase-like protein